MMEIPTYRQMAIDFEEKLIDLRTRQIEASKMRILLMKRGEGYRSALDSIKGIHGNLKFDWDTYEAERKKFKFGGKNNA